jgi:hypothetical protein
MGHGQHINTGQVLSYFSNRINIVELDRDPTLMESLEKVKQDVCCPVQPWWEFWWLDQETHLDNQLDLASACVFRDFGRAWVPEGRNVQPLSPCAALDRDPVLAITVCTQMVALQLQGCPQYDAGEREHN